MIVVKYADPAPPIPGSDCRFEMSLAASPCRPINKWRTWTASNLFPTTTENLRGDCLKPPVLPVASSWPLTRSGHGPWVSGRWMENCPCLLGPVVGRGFTWFIGLRSHWDLGINAHWWLMWCGEADQGKSANSNHAVCPHPETKSVCMPPKTLPMMMSVKKNPASCQNCPPNQSPRTWGCPGSSEGKPHNKGLCLQRGCPEEN